MKSHLRELALLIACSLVPQSLLAKEVTLGGDRPASLKLPFAYNSKQSYPLVLLLHGRGNTAALTDLYLGLSRSQNQEGYLLLLPNGTVRDDGNRVWNATDECCATNNKDVDDSKYLQDLVAEAKAKFNVDPKRVYIFGHSNGGFMAYRLACDTNGLFAGVVSLAGSEFANAEDCKTQTPISILQVHGTEDTIVPFDSKAQGKAYPGAFETTQRWADRNRCQTKEVKLLSQNLVYIKIEPGLDENGNPIIVGDFWDYIVPSFKPETDEFLFDNCDDDVRVGLWRINGSNHGPVFLGKNYVGKALKFLERR